MAYYCKSTGEFVSLDGCECAVCEPPPRDPTPEEVNAYYDWLETQDCGHGVCLVLDCSDCIKADKQAIRLDMCTGECVCGLCDFAAAEKRRLDL